MAESELGELAGWRGADLLAELPACAAEDAEEQQVPEEVTMLLSMLGNEHEAYWGRRYGKELTAVRASLAMGASDPMESLFVWFGKMAMLMACQLIQSEELGLKTDTSVVLDLGCGNGFVCEVLHAMGFKHVIGVDYSPQAIRLALTVQEHFRSQAPPESSMQWGTTYLLDDILRTRLRRQSVHIVHDCGTLDSIAMTLPPPAPPFDPFAPPAGVQAAAGSALDSSGDAQESGHAEVDSEGLQRGDAEELCATGIEGYFRNVAAILRPEGYLLLRTCNHSAEEVQDVLRRCRCALRFVRNVEEDTTSSGVLTLLIQKEAPAVAPSA